MAGKKTPTRFVWSFLDNGAGALLQRFSRKLPHELWLYGLERPEDSSLAAGKYIIEPDGSHREAKRAVWPFAISPEDAPAVLALIEASGFKTGPFPTELVEAILHRCELADPLQAMISDRDVERIASAVAERLAA